MTFEEWLRARLPAMLRLATALSGSPAAGEDLVQDVVIKAHRRWDQIAELDRPEAYLRQMLVNEHLSWRRRLASAVRRDTAVSLETAGERRPFDQQEVDRIALLGEIRRLPPRLRAVIVLRYLDELTVAEAAQVIGCTESTVRAHTTRALARLRISLTDAPATTPQTSSGPDFVKERHAH